jgi:hypothetical protein
MMRAGEDLMIKLKRGETSSRSPTFTKLTMKAVNATTRR